MATVPHYAVKRAFLDGAIVLAEFPMYSVSMCLPRGSAGDVAFSLWVNERPSSSDGTRSWPKDFDMVLFLLMLGESMVHP